MRHDSKPNASKRAAPRPAHPNAPARSPHRSPKPRKSIAGASRATAVDKYFEPSRDDSPAMVWEIIDRHDLGLRADSPLAAATVLLTDAAFDLTELSRAVSREQALTSEAQGRVVACITKLADALKLAAFCPSEASPGVMVEAADGTLTGSPAEPADESR